MRTPARLQIDNGTLPEGAYVSVECNRLRTTILEAVHTDGRSRFPLPTSSHATMQIREAEQKAQEALHQASLAYKELHRLKGD